MLRFYEEWVVVGVCSVSFLFGLMFCTPATIQMVNIFDTALGSWNILLFALLEVILVGWIYGMDHFLDNLKQMDIQIYLITKWYFAYYVKYILPIVICCILGDMYCQQLSSTSVLEQILTYVTVIPIPIMAIWMTMTKYKKEALFRPTEDFKPAMNEDDRGLRITLQKFEV